MNRFVAGRFATSEAVREVTPRDGRDVLALPGVRVWSVGHGARETTVTPTGGGGVGGQLVTAGHCLATAAEREAALRVAQAGDVLPALHLPGSYLAIVRASGKMWVAGDRAGVVPVYWLEEDDDLWWATAAAPLAALIGASPDLPWLLAELTLNGVDTRLNGAHFERVRRVPPGYALVLEEDASPHVVNTVPPQALGLVDGVKQLRDAFTTAVTRRAQIYERLTADLSGGVDSSSITSLAARTRPLLAVTYTDAHMADQDDVHYALRTAAETDAITHRLIDGRTERLTHFDGLDGVAALPLTDQPALALGLLTLLEHQLAPAVTYESQAHLTGRGGDNVLDASSTHLVDQFLAGHRARALRRAARYARAWRVAPWQVWRELGRTAATSYPRALGRLAGKLGGTVWLARTSTPEGWENLTWCGTRQAAGWLTGPGRRAVADLVAARAHHTDPGITPAVLHDRLALEWMAASHAAFDSIARQQWGLAIHAPFLDTPVVDACMAIPSYQRVQPGIYKPLARAALTGLAPDFLLQRETKTAFTSSLYDGLAANAPTLRRVIGNSLLAQAGLINARPAAAALEAAIAGAPAPLADLHTLIVTELWLARLERARTTWWQPERSTTCP